MAAAGEMLIDRLAPNADGVRTEHAIVAGAPDAVYPCVVEADFVRAVNENRAVRSLVALRSGAERVLAAVRGREPVASPPADVLRLRDLPDEGEWVLLGEDRPAEIAFGAIGRFWGGETSWEPIRSADFELFNRPGFAKIACAFSLRRYGAARTLLSYEARTTAIGEEARRGFCRYWRVVSPFVGVVMRSQLRVIARDAAAAGAGP